MYFDFEVEQLAKHCILCIKYAYTIADLANVTIYSTILCSLEYWNKVEYIRLYCTILNAYKISGLYTMPNYYTILSYTIV